MERLTFFLPNSGRQIEFLCRWVSFSSLSFGTLLCSSCLHKGWAVDLNSAYIWEVLIAAGSMGSFEVYCFSCWQARSISAMMAIAAKYLRTFNFREVSRYMSGL